MARARNGIDKLRALIALVVVALGALTVLADLTEIKGKTMVALTGVLLLLAGQRNEPEYPRRIEPAPETPTSESPLP